MKAHMGFYVGVGRPTQCQQVLIDPDIGKETFPDEPVAGACITAERYKDIALPETVRNAVAERYPKWAISKDIYQVKYKENSYTIRFINLFSITAING